MSTKTMSMLISLLLLLLLFLLAVVEKQRLWCRTGRSRHVHAKARPTMEQHYDYAIATSNLDTAEHTAEGGGVDKGAVEQASAA